MEEGVEHCLARHTCSMSFSSCMPGCFRPPMVVFHGIISLSWRGKCSQRVCQRQVTSVALAAYCPPLFFLLSSFLVGWAVITSSWAFFFLSSLFFSLLSHNSDCFYISKALIKKINFILFFFLLQINIFLCFQIILMRWCQK